MNISACCMCCMLYAYTCMLSRKFQGEMVGDDAETVKVWG